MRSRLPISHRVTAPPVAGRWPMRCSRCWRDLTSSQEDEASEHNMSDREVAEFLCRCPAFDVEGELQDPSRE